MACWTEGDVKVHSPVGSWLPAKVGQGTELLLQSEGVESSGEDLLLIGEITPGAVRSRSLVMPHVELTGASCSFQPMVLWSLDAVRFGSSQE